MLRDNLTFNNLTLTQWLHYVLLGLTRKNSVPTQKNCVFCTNLRYNCEFCAKLHKVTGFCNGDGECLLRGTNWIFKLKTLSFEIIDFNCLK